MTFNIKIEPSRTLNTLNIIGYSGCDSL